MLRPDCLLADENKSEMQILLDQHIEMKAGMGSMDLVHKKGQDLLDFTFKYLAKPENQKNATGPELAELRNHQKLLGNYISVKKSFEKCLKNKNQNEQLSGQILKSAYQNLMNTAESSPCVSTISNFKNFDEFNHQIVKVMKEQTRPLFQDELSKQIMINTAKSLLGFKYKFDQSFMTNGVLNQNDLTQIIESVCHQKSRNARNTQSSIFDACQSFGGGFQKKLESNIIAQANHLKTYEKRFTPLSATQSLNESIDRINGSLNSIEFKNDKGFIYDSPQLNNDKSQVAFENYLHSYMGEIQKDAGVLLLTKAMKDKAGGLKNYNSSDTEKDKKNSQFKFTPHLKVKSEDVKDSIKEAETKILDQARSIQNTIKLKKTDSSFKERVKDLARLNPFAAGQVLIRNPEYAGIMCDAMNEIMSDDETHKKMDEAFVFGSAIIGGALLLTVVGTAAGAYLLSGSVAAGLALGTTGGSIIAYSTLAAGATELVSLGYYGKKSFESFNSSNKLESAYLTNNSNSEAIIEARDSLLEYKEARFSALLSLGSIGLLSLSGGSFFNLFKSSKNNISPQVVREASKMMMALKDNVVVQRLKEVITALGPGGSEKLNNFFLYLTREGEVARVNFLNQLKDSRFTPEKIKKIIEESLKVTNTKNGHVLSIDELSDKVSNPIFNANEKEEFAKTMLKLNLSNDELENALLKINKVTQSNIDKNRMQNYLNFTSSLRPGDQKIALDQLQDVVLLSNNVNPGGFVEKFYKKENKFYVYEQKRQNVIKTRLLKEGKTEVVASEEAEDFARKSRLALQQKFYACQSKTVTPEHILAAKRYTALALGSGLIGTTYGYTKTNGDKFNENKVQWFGKLGYDIAMTFFMTKLNAKILSSPSGSFAKRYVQSNVGSALTGTVDALVYSEIYGVSEAEARTKIDKILKDPEAQKELKIFDAYIEKTDLLNKFTDSVVSGFKKIINSPEKETLLGKAPYEMGEVKFSNLSNEDLDKPEIKEKLVQAALFQMNSGDPSAMLSSGDKGLDRWINDRAWGASVGTAKGIFVGMGIYQILCLGIDQPFASMGLAIGLQFANQLISGESYYQFRKKLIGQ